MLMPTISLPSSVRGPLLAALLVAAAAGNAAMADYPERGVTLIVPYGAGGGTDVSARLLAKDLEAALGKPVTVENRAGGGGWIGWGALAKAPPDGYTIGYLNVPSIYAGYLDPAIGRPERLESFTPLSNHVTDFCIWAVKADSPFKMLKDVIAAARSNPEKISISAFGAGGDDHIAILSMQQETGAKFAIVHHRSTPEAKTQVLGGHLDVLAANVSEVAEDVKAGTIRLLGVMAPERSRFYPNVPTFKEQGFSQIWSVSRGIAAPGGLPKDVEAKLIDALKTTLTAAEHRKKAEALSLEPSVIIGADYARFLKDNEQSIKKLMGW
jgi:tripartite-type tricarboxylate transporter receptor subunit TctC